MIPPGYRCNLGIPSPCVVGHALLIAFFNATVPCDSAEYATRRLSGIVPHVVRAADDLNGSTGHGPPFSGSCPRGLFPTETCVFEHAPLEGQLGAWK